MIYIYVEGIADVKFLSDYIKHLKCEYEIDIPKKSKAIIRHNDRDIAFIEAVYGWEKIGSEAVVTQLQQNTNRDISNIIIFDADTDCEKRREEIRELCKECTFDLFLFPNNQDNGALEDLLEKLIPNKNHPILDCWNGYIGCIKSKKIEGRNEELHTPDRKAKIYAYMEALLGDSKQVKEECRDYNDTNLWDLDVEYLHPLKDYLLNILNGIK